MFVAILNDNVQQEHFMKKQCNFKLNKLQVLHRRPKGELPIHHSGTSSRGSINWAFQKWEKMGQI